MTGASAEAVKLPGDTIDLEGHERVPDPSILFSTQYASLVQLAFLLGRSNAIAEELVQDAFAQLLRRWNKIDYPKAYLRATVINLCRSHLRRTVLDRRRLSLRATAAVDSPDEMSDALARLSSRKRTAIVLRFYGDFTEAQIASALNCRPGTVKSSL